MQVGSAPPPSTGAGHGEEDVDGEPFDDEALDLLKEAAADPRTRLT